MGKAHPERVVAEAVAQVGFASLLAAQGAQLGEKVVERHEGGAKWVGVAKVVYANKFSKRGDFRSVEGACLANKYLYIYRRLR
ncbi:hypothetical protein GCM10028821_27320 [Hymenobacter jeollabukensis]